MGRLPQCECSEMLDRRFVVFITLIATDWTPVLSPLFLVLSPYMTTFFPDVWLQQSCVTVGSSLLNHHTADTLTSSSTPCGVSKRPLMSFFLFCFFKSRYKCYDWSTVEPTCVFFRSECGSCLPRFQTVWVMSVPPTHNITSVAAYRGSDWLLVYYVIMTVM